MSRWDEIRRAIVSRSDISADEWVITSSERNDMPASVVEWQVGRPSRIIVGQQTYDHPQLDFFAWRLAFTTPLFNEVGRLTTTERGTLKLSLGDAAGTVRGIAFCSSDPADLLVPDTSFITTDGYADFRPNAGSVPWRERERIAFWRGTTTGVWPHGDWRRLQRLELCRISVANASLIDAGISRVALAPSAEGAEAEIKHAGLMREPVSAHDFSRYRYQIDVDGNSNSWPGLFIKLLTGSPILKIASPRGYRQWYYDRLVPWQNFVPVSVDMDDLVEKVRWLDAHDDEARAIGAASLDLGLSLTYENAIGASAKLILNSVIAAEAEHHDGNGQ